MGEKKVNALSDVYRGLGILEGLACGLPDDAQQLAYTATEMIEKSLEVLLE